jgi:uncharacterized protein (TIGR02588 family)
MLVAVATAFLVYHALTRDRAPPEARAIVERVLEVENGYLVQFRASNQGGSAAAELTIEGEVARAAGSNEVSEAVLDYVPAGSDREGGPWFSHDPRARQFTLRANGYADPCAGTRWPAQADASAARPTDDLQP